MNPGWPNGDGVMATLDDCATTVILKGTAPREKAQAKAKRRAARAARKKTRK